VQRVEEEEELQMKPEVQRASSGAGFEVEGEFEQQLAASRGGGSPLPSEVRSFMEPRFGADFSGVRLHTGGESAQLNRSVSAQAFTLGQDIYLGEGKDDLESAQGKELLAHELTHTIQQTGGIQRKVEHTFRGEVGFKAALFEKGGTMKPSLKFRRHTKSIVSLLTRQRRWSYCRAFAMPARSIKTSILTRRI
jgi:hypothetical protein